MAKAKKEVKEATISETKVKKKKEEKVEEVEEEVIEEVKEEKVEKSEKNKKEKKKKVGFFSGIRKEMKQVVWPSAGDIVKSTIAVVVMCLFLCLFFLAIMAVMALIKKGLLG